jgi:hypothetical protein
LPAMLSGPAIVRKIISPMITHYPRFISLALIGLGCSTLGFRLWSFYANAGQSCH